MWCSNCQHDVRAADGDSRSALCGDCGAVLASEAADCEPHAAQPQAAMPPCTGLLDDDWKMEADRRSIERLVAGLWTTRIDPALPLVAPHSLRDSVGEARHAPAIHLAAWSLLALGLALFSCGAVLLIWSLAADRDDLWSIGLPLSLAGQAGLIIGLGLHLDGLWRHSRQNSDALTALDSELARVRQGGAAPAGLVIADGRSLSLHAGAASSLASALPRMVQPPAG